MALAILIWGVPANSSTSVQVVGVHDGDTIRVVADGHEIKIRLYGIDAPESAQAYSRISTHGLKMLLAGRKINIDAVDTDRYGRTVAIVYADGATVNEAMVANGLAWVFPKYCRKSFCSAWHAAENRAKTDQRGLWQDPAPLPPWEWRRARRR